MTKPSTIWIPLIALVAIGGCSGDDSMSASDKAALKEKLSAPLKNPNAPSGPAAQAPAPAGDSNAARHAKEAGGKAPGG